MLRYALQAEADDIGATIQAKESSLPQITPPVEEHEQPISAEKPVAAMQGILQIIEGAGVLIEGTAVKQHRPGRAMILTLLGFAAILTMALFGPTWIENSQPLTATPERRTTPISAIKNAGTPARTPRPEVQLIPTL